MVLKSPFSLKLNMILFRQSRLPQCCHIKQGISILISPKSDGKSIARQNKGNSGGFWIAGSTNNVPSPSSSSIAMLPFYQTNMTVGQNPNTPINNSKLNRLISHCWDVHLPFFDITGIDPYIRTNIRSLNQPWQLETIRIFLEQYGSSPQTWIMQNTGSRNSDCEDHQQKHHHFYTLSARTLPMVPRQTMSWGPEALLLCGHGRGRCRWWIACRQWSCNMPVIIPLMNVNK